MIPAKPPKPRVLTAELIQEAMDEIERRSTGPPEPLIYWCAGCGKRGYLTLKGLEDHWEDVHRGAECA